MSFLYIEEFRIFNIFKPNNFNFIPQKVLI